MGQVKNGDKVKVHYTAKLEDGRVFESTHDNPPLDFVVGDKNMLPGLEDGVIGMEVGESLLTNSDSTLDKAESGITAVRSKVPRSQAFLDIQC